MATQTRRIITLDETDADAVRFEHFVRVPDQNGGAERVLTSKTVAADILFPELGTLSVLPPRCRFQAEREGTAVYVIEDEPAVRTVHWDTSAPVDIYGTIRSRLMHSRTPVRLGQKTFHLAFPYLVRLYVFHQGAFVKLFLWYRTKPMENEQAELLFSNLPNCFATTGQVCLGGDYPNDHATSGTIIALAEHLFWGTAFSADYLEGFAADATRVPELASPWEWEAASKADPRFVLSLDWRTTDLTIGEAVRRELNAYHPGRRARVFDMLARRIQVADPYERRSEAQEGGVKQSPAEAVVLRDVTLHVGDSIYLEDGHGTIRGLRRGRTYRIEWFGRTIAGERAVKLEGVAEPVVIVSNNLLVSGVRVKGVSLPIIEIGDVRITEGTRIRFEDANRWPGLSGTGWQTVRRAVRNTAGAVNVILENQTAFVTVADETGLAPGVRVAQEIPNRNGVLPDDTFTLSDGAVVRVGGYIFANRGNGSMALWRIEQFMALTPGGRTHLLRARDDRGTLQDFQFELLNGQWNAAAGTLLGADYECETLDLMSGIIRRGGPVRIDLITYPVQAILKPIPGNPVRYLKINGNWHAVGHGFSAVPEVTVTADEACVNGVVFKRGASYAHLTTGEVKTIASFERDGSDVHAIFDDGGRVRIFENGAPTRELAGPVALKTKVGARTIARGDVLRLRVAIGDAQACTEFRVSHIIPGTGDTPAQIVFGGNKAIDGEPSSLRFFAIRVRGKWQPLGRGAAELPAQRTYRPGQSLGQGVRVRYLGRDTNVPLQFENDPRNRTVLATIESNEPCCSARHWICRFDELIGGIRNPHIAASRLERVPELPAVFTEPRQGSRAIDASARCVNQGALVGTNRYGRRIFIGDRVRARELSVESVKDLPANHVFTVVHHGANNFGTWLYLDAGHAIGQAIRPSVVGIEQIPIDLRNDPAWWARMVWAYIGNCEVV